MLICKMHKGSTGEEEFLTVEQFLDDIKATFGATTKHRQLVALSALVDGRFYQDMEIAYYIPEAISEFAREKLERDRQGG